MDLLDISWVLCFFVRKVVRNCHPRTQSGRVMWDFITGTLGDCPGDDAVHHVDLVAYPCW